MRYSVTNDLEMKRLIEKVVQAAKYVKHKDDRYITDYSDPSEIELQKARSALEDHINEVVFVHSDE